MNQSFEPRPLRALRHYGFRTKICAPLICLWLAACGPDRSNDVKLERGQWRMETSYGSPQIDGLTIDDLRWKFPPDEVKVACGQPHVHLRPDFLNVFGFKEDTCKIVRSSIANGRITAEGPCQKVADSFAKRGGDGKIDLHGTESWIEVEGNYDPQLLSMEAKIAVTATESNGTTTRMTVFARHKSERLGECP